MRINYQVLNFNYNKVIEVINYLNKFNYKKAIPIYSVIIGDFSCIKRNNSMLKKNKEFKEFLKYIRKNKIRILLQLPLITKEDEMKETIKLVKRNFNNFNGFLTGDLGVVSILDNMNRKRRTKKKIIYTTNVFNKTFSDYLKEKFVIWRIRPLMFKRIFIEEDIGFDKDIVIYGNMMLNCSTYCLHSGDLPTKCTLSCKNSKDIIMGKEIIHLIGRSLITQNRFDLLKRLKHIKNIKSISVMDYNLSNTEIKEVIDIILDYK